MRKSIGKNGAVRDKGGHPRPKIKRGYLPTLEIYDVTKDELDTLEHGTPAKLFLEFTIAFWSIAISLLTALTTADFKSITQFNVFLVITVVSFVAGIVLTFLWWRTRASVRNIVEKIRSRIAVPNR